MKYRNNIISFVIGLLIATPLLIVTLLTTYGGEVEAEETEISFSAGAGKVLEYTKKPEKMSYLGQYKVTAYCPCEICCGEYADGLTFTETIATEGRTIAVDPDVIPLGSKIWISGIEYIAEDIGGAVDENHVDIFFNSHEDALKYGVQKHGVFLCD